MLRHSHSEGDKSLGLSSPPGDEIRNNPNCHGPWVVTPPEGGLCTPLHCVPDLPWGPWQASPLTLPLTVIQGVEVPNGLLVPSLLKSDSSNQSTKQVSFLLFSSVFLAAWHLLLNVSQWVLNTIRKGHRIQFAFRPARFNDIVATVVRQE